MTLQPDPTHPAPPRRGAVAFVLVTVVLDVISLGITIPVLPRLIESLSAGNTARAAIVFGAFSMIWAVMQVLFSPVLGALSDRYGRRPVLLISTLGLGLDYILMALAPSIAWLLIGRILNGICAATFSTANAYITDVTPEAERAKQMGLVGAAFGVGFVLGPAIGGLLGAADPRLPFWVAAAFSLANAAYGYFVLPESLPPERRSPFKLKSANPIGALRFLTASPPRARLTLVLFLFHLAHAVLPSLFALYAGYRYGWDEKAVGLALAGFGVMAILVQGVLMRPVIGRLGEARALAIGLTAGLLAMLIGALAPSTLWFWLALLILPFWGFATPAAQALITRSVSASEQGRLQGATSSLMGIANIVGPLIFTQTFALAIAPERALNLPGLPFLLAGALLATALLIANRIRPPETPEGKPSP